MWCVTLAAMSIKDEIKELTNIMHADRTEERMGKISKKVISQFLDKLQLFAKEEIDRKRVLYLPSIVKVEKKKQKKKGRPQKPKYSKSGRRLATSSFVSARHV